MKTKTKVHGKYSPHIALDKRLNRSQRWKSIWKKWECALGQSIACQTLVAFSVPKNMQHGLNWPITVVTGRISSQMPPRPLLIRQNFALKNQPKENLKIRGNLQFPQELLVIRRPLTTMKQGFYREHTICNRPPNLSIRNCTSHSHRDANNLLNQILIQNCL